MGPVPGHRAKIVSFFISVLDSEHPIMCLTETWLTADLATSELFTFTYTMLCSDKSGCRCRGGRVLIANHTSSLVHWFILATLLL